MRLETSSLPTTAASADATALPQLQRGPMAFTRPAPSFTRAMNLAQQMQPGGVWVPLQRQASLANSGLQTQVAATSLAPEASGAPWTATVRSGQTLSGIIREQMAVKGAPVNSSEALRLSQLVARSNSMSNPNLIHPGQQINLDSLNLSLNQALASRQAIAAAAKVEQQAVASSGADQAGSYKAVGSTQVQLQSRSDTNVYPVLDKTLDRAVSKGFISSQDRQAVYNKIVQLSVQHRFSPDDFARLTLMESDGMNPKATNTRCHGIIQFCDGADRGAASVGFASNPRAILGHSVLQQLDMVDKYFDETGLRNIGPVGLDDLYLTVLTPAARNETRPNAALNIPGQQAAYLHVNRDTSAPITRNSILAGLHFNANERLRDGAQASAGQRQRGALASLSGSAQAAKGLSAYAAQAVDDSESTR